LTLRTTQALVLSEVRGPLRVKTDKAQQEHRSHFQKNPALFDAAPSNWLAAHPDIYLFGSLVEAEMSAPTTSVRPPGRRAGRRRISGRWRWWR